MSIGGGAEADVPIGPEAARTALRHQDEGGQVEDAMDAIAKAMDPQADARRAVAQPDSGLSGVAPPEAARSDAGAERALIAQALERGIRALEAEGDRPALAIRASISALVDQIYGAQDRRSAREAEQRARRELADLFLEGADTGATDPRLAEARGAQSAMERHITRLFGDDPDQIMAAIRESRQRISDALRRGQQVSVRGDGLRA